MWVDTNPMRVDIFLFGLIQIPCGLILILYFPVRVDTNPVRVDFNNVPANTNPAPVDINYVRTC